MMSGWVSVSRSLLPFRSQPPGWSWACPSWWCACAPSRPCSKRSPRKPASSSRWPCSMVPMPPSRIRMRSASAASSRATRSGCSQGRVLIGYLSFLLREQADDFEMWRLALAAEPIATDHLQTGGAGVVPQFHLGEAEVAVVERFHRGAVVVLAQGHREQAPAGTQQAGGRGHGLRGAFGVGERVQHQYQVEAALAEIQRVHVALAHFDVAESLQALRRGLGHALAGIHADDGV